MFYLKVLSVFFVLFATYLVHAEDIHSNEDAELIKLKIRELELKKEILELETKKDSQATYQTTPPQPYASPTNSNSGYSAPRSNDYIRGPRGGCYTFSASGNKRYVDRSLCN